MPSPASARTSTPRRLAAIVVGALVFAEIALRACGVGAAPAVKCRLRREDDAAGELVYHCYPSNPWNELQPPPDVSRGNWRLTKLTVPTVDLPLTDLAKTPWCVEYRRDGRDVRG